MQLPKNILQQSLAIALFGACALSLAFIIPAPTQGDSVLPIKPAVVPITKSATYSGVSMRLRIPSINVDAAVEAAGVGLDGNMGVPKGPDGVTWYMLGPRPGEAGSAVMAGHYGWKNGKAAVFDGLHTLRIGDMIYVDNEQGATVTFVVRELRTYDQNEDATDVFTSNDARAHLNLITCEGAWNAAQKSYSDRLIVFADEKSGQ